jgi:hypothetical protein
MYGINPPMNNGTHNYVMDSFSGSTFPFAIGQCTSTSVVSSSVRYKYTCNKIGTGWTVTKRQYANKICNGTGTLVTTWTSKNATSGTYGSSQMYECDGVNSYVELQISLSDDCSGGATVYAALGACTSTSTGTTQFEFFCNNTVALSNFYLTTNVSSLNQTTHKPSVVSTLLNTILANYSYYNTTYYETTLAARNASNLLCFSKDYCEVWTMPSGECSLANTTAFRNAPASVYGKFLSCQTNPVSTSSGSTTTTSISTSTSSVTSLFTSTSSSTSTSTSSTSTTKKPNKSGSTRLQLAVSMIFTLLLAVSWL